MGISIVTTGVLLLGAPAEPPTFPEIWYREVMLGDHAGASEDYQALFLSPPSARVRADMRQKAALRAGICFERLGQLEYARSAYTSVPTLGHASGPVVEEALIRLKGLSSTEPLPEGPAAAPIDLAIAKQLESQRAMKVERERSLAQLTQEVSTRRAAARERGELLDRLSRRGLDLVPPAGAATIKAAAILDILRRALREADVARVEAILGERLQENALLVLIEGDRGRAADHVQAAVSVQGKTALSDWLSAAIAADFPAAAAASRRLAEERFQRVVSLRRDVSALLVNAELFAFDRGRPDLALGELDKVRDRLERADRSLRSDHEARSLESRAGRLLLGLGRGSGEERILFELWKAGRDEVEAAVVAAEELVSLLREEAPFAGRLEPVRPEGGRDIALGEAERLLAGAREAGARGDKEARERLLREAEWIQRWIPGLADRGRMDTLEVNEAPLPAGERRP